METELEKEDREIRLAALGILEALVGGYDAHLETTLFNFERFSNDLSQKSTKILKRAGIFK